MIYADPATTTTTRAARGLCAIFVALLISFAGIIQVQAQSFSSPIDLTGYAWSENIGWISLNCSDQGVCSTSDYGVQINPDQTMSGYAWSEHIGWIQFGGLDGCPAGDCTARVGGSDTGGWYLEGWARALSYGSGWDGWISLSCTNTDTCGVSNYAVRLGSSGGFETAQDQNGSFAWGSDVVGWMSFAYATYGSPCAVSQACTVDQTGVLVTNQWCETTETSCPAGFSCSPATANCDTAIMSAPDISITASQQLVRSGDTVTIAWDPNGFVGNCRLTPASIFTSANANASGSLAVIHRNTRVYGYHCEDTTDIYIEDEKSATTTVRSTPAQQET